MSATTITATDLWRLSATELAEAVRSRQTSSQEIIEAHLRRIERINPSINAITVVLGDQALRAAKVADREVAASSDLPPFHGVPFTVQGEHRPARHANHARTKGPRRRVSTPGRSVVERPRAAGATPIGRTNLTSLAVRWHTDSQLWGATVNPWDRSRTPGGSSGGEAAALATGMSPLGLGNGGLGSLRWPAHCCGISVLKPTLGRTPHATSIEPVDAPIGVQLTARPGPDGAAGRQSASRPGGVGRTQLARPLDGARTPPRPRTRQPRPSRPGVDPAGQGITDQVQDGLRKAALALEDAGYAVEELERPSIDLAAKSLLDMLNTPDIRAAWTLLLPAMPADTQRFMAETIRSMRMAVAVNALGLPAVAVPVGVGGGLPQVMQVIGPRYREDLCLDAAAALEDRVGVIAPIDPRWR